MINPLVWDTVLKLKLTAVAALEDGVVHGRLTNGIQTMELYLYDEDYVELADAIKNLKKEKPDV